MERTSNISMMSALYSTNSFTFELRTVKSVIILSVYA